MARPATLPPAYRVSGPSALTGDPRRLAHLAFTLAVTDWKLRFFGSLLGYVWSLLRPVLLFSVLYVVFSQIVQLDAGVPNYPLLLLAGIVLFYTFSEMTTGAVTALVDRETLLRKVSFPRLAVPLSVALLATFNLALNLITVAVFVLASGVQPRWTWLLLPLPVLGLLVLGTGLAMLLSALYVSFRDVRPIWEVVAQALFYATPILYPVQRLVEQADWMVKVAMANPLAVLIQQFRHFLLGPEVPTAAEVMGGAAWLALPGGVLLGVAALGFVVFNRLAPYVAEEL